MKQRHRSFLLVLALLLLMALGGYSLYHIVVNDRFNAEASAGNLQSMQVSLRQGADLEGRSIHFMTPLMSASKGGKQAAALFLLSHNADVNAHNDSGSVLMWAVASGNAGLVRTLLAHGAEVNWHTNLGDTALKTAKEYKQPVITKMLQLAGAKN